MAYRKIEVNGSTYDYTVGKSYIKIRGLGAYNKFVLGDRQDDYVSKVTPAHIKAIIVNGVKPDA